jgi:hypothetical protein
LSFCYDYSIKKFALEIVLFFFFLVGGFAPEPTLGLRPKPRACGGLSWGLRLQTPRSPSRNEYEYQEYEYLVKYLTFIYF